MPIIWETKKINIQNYYKIIRRTIIFNADDGTKKSGYKAWKKFKKECTLRVLPADQLDKYKHFFNHLTVETSNGIAWGITGLNEITMFIVDSRNPFVIRSNAMPLGHELLHWIYQWAIGTTHITRRFEAPDGKAGTKGPAATVIVHDNWYGNKKRLTFWISWLVGWLPISIPYIPIKEAKKLYSL